MKGGEYGTATAPDVLSGKTIGTESGLVTGTLTIESLGGREASSGTVALSSSTLSFQTSSGSKSLNYFTVSGLSFSPSIIVAVGDDGRLAAVIVRGYTWNGYEIITNSAYTCYLTGNAYINSNGFRLPTTLYTGSVHWYAFK